MPKTQYIRTDGIKAPEVTQELADTLARIAKTQLRTSRQFKSTRMEKVKESEDLYAGQTQKQLKNPFDFTFPFMSGFVEHYVAKIDNPPKITYSKQDEADYKTAKKITAAFEKESASPMPNAKWNLKDRWAKKMAIFSGRGIYKFFAENAHGYQSHFEVVDHYDFHCQPNGGGHLENHLYCGQEGIEKSKEELEEGAKDGYYDSIQVAELVRKDKDGEYMETRDNNRQEAMGLDPKSNNYVGQASFTFVEWYLTYKGVRWYVLFDEMTGLWVRVKPLSEVVPAGPNTTPLYPYVTWATHEDPRNFWSKSPADDARDVAKYINKALNQELYNREKQNKGQRAYDADMFYDVEALADWRPDGLVPADTKNGSRQIRSGLYEFNIAGLGGTIDLVTFLDAFTGRQTGNTAGSQGAAPDDTKVGIYFGELQQVDDFINVRNRSYSEAWEEIGIRYVMGLDKFLVGKMEIELMGAEGVEWSELSRKDLRRNRELDIKVKGGTQEAAENEMDLKKKQGALAQVQTVSPRWRDEQVLRNAGYNEDDIRQAFTTVPPASQELLSEAIVAIEDLLTGREVKLNRGADAQYIQKILDYSIDTDTLTMDQRILISNFALAHVEIAAENMGRKAYNFLRDRKMQMPPEAQGAMPSATPKPVIPSPMQFQQSPRAAATAVGERASNQFQQSV